MFLQIIEYLEWLNATRFVESPILIPEVIEFTTLYGEEGYLNLLRKWWDEHNHFDTETL